MEINFYKIFCQSRLFFGKSIVSAFSQFERLFITIFGLYEYLNRVSLPLNLFRVAQFEDSWCSLNVFGYFIHVLRGLIF